MLHASTRSVSHSSAFLFLLLSLFLPKVSVAQDDGAPTESGLSRKEQAIGKLGNRLAAVAARHGKSPNKLRQMFLQDSTLYVDKNDRLLYVEDAPDPAELAASEEPSAPQAAAFPHEQTFTLHSRPGSNRVIYLDFDGHTLSPGSSWLSYLSGTGGVAQPFDIDNNPAFNIQELEMIQAVWQRVSEDFAPFDVDVTTQDPGADALLRTSYQDTRFGMRAVLTKTNFMGAGVGGVAYVGTFDYPGSDMYHPAWIFTSSFGTDKGIAEAASHEIGHSLGLSHDGTSSQGYYSGHGVWSPIMGVGYYTGISQWSKGEYPGANNTEDDLTIMQSRGISLIADDYGNTPAAAYSLNGTSISASGLITTRTDVDVFRFTTGSGDVSIKINPALRGGNLDIQAQLLDSAGNVLATSNPSSYAPPGAYPAGIAASFNQFLSAGTYYLKIDGVGSASDDITAGYSDYASLGQYFITGTLVAGGSQPQSPVAVVSANSVSGAAPLTINFSSAGSNDPDGSIVGYGWDFGDGTGSTASNPSKIYSSAGTFTATLTVTDNSGLTGSKSVVITATNPVSAPSIAGMVKYGITPAGQSAKYITGVLMKASGSSVVSCSTGANGSYSLGNLVSGAPYLVNATKTGNVNGITSVDATLILRHVASSAVLTGNQLIAADTNNSGTITSIDATLILRYGANGSQTVETGKVGSWKFTPENRNYGAVSGSLSNQNYEAVIVGDVNGSWTPTSGVESEDKNEWQEKSNSQKQKSDDFLSTDNYVLVEEALGNGADTFLSSPLEQQTETQLQVSLPAIAAGRNGDAVSIPITLINGGASIAAYTFEVTFNPSVLQPQAFPINTAGTISASGFGGGGCQVITNLINATPRATLRLVAACPRGINNSGVLINLLFNVVGMADTATAMTTLEFTTRSGSNLVPIFENEIGTIATDIINGSFTVVSPAPNSPATISGRVITTNGRGLRNAQVRLTASDGTTKTVVSGPFGYYSFVNLVVGQPVTIQVFSKQYGFQPQTVNLSVNLNELNFFARP